MNKDTLIEHKEVAIVCEEIGHVGLSYNVILTTLEANLVVKPIVPTIIAKSSLTLPIMVKHVIHLKPIITKK
jgi:hypothetical protein